MILISVLYLNASTIVGPSPRDKLSTAAVYWTVDTGKTFYTDFGIDTF